MVAGAKIVDRAHPGHHQAFAPRRKRGSCIDHPLPCRPSRNRNRRFAGGRAGGALSRASSEIDRPLRSDDVVWIPADTRHWHRAQPNSAMSHYAIVEPLNGSNVQWMEKVTDEQYGPQEKGACKTSTTT